MPVAIVSDTCHYLPREIADRIAVHEVSLYVHSDGIARRESEVRDYDSFYGSLASASELPTTSQPSIGDFLAVYEPLIASGHEILSIHLSGGLSGTVRSAQQAREQLGQAADRVQVVDTETACGAEGLMLLAAAAAIGAGGDAAAAAQRARDARQTLQFLFALDTLEYLRKGGRIGGAQAWLGSALKIKPILSLESEIGAVERVRTSRKAFERLVTLIEKMKADGADAWVVQHTQQPEQAQALIARGREILGCDPVFVSEIGPVIGTHVGPGLIGAGGLPRALMAELGV
jgi:DegV family protein with EDD domain